MATANPMELAPLTPAEKGEAQGVIGAVLASVSVNLEATDRDELSRLPASFQADGGEFWAVRAKGAVVGTIGIRPAGTPGEWRLKYLCLLPDWHRQGIGRMLAEHAIEYARKHQARRISVQSHTDWTASFKLFHSLQFQIVDEIDLKTYTGPFIMRRVFVGG